jgi:diamine N-acetyltransferase
MIRIFKLSVADAEWLSLVATRAYFDSYTHLWFDNDASWYVERCFNVEQLKRELLDENTLFFGVEDATEGLGFLKLNVNYPLSKNACQADYLELLTFETDENANALELERIYLTKNGQGRGIGKRLVQLTFDLARSHKKEVVWLKAMDTSFDALGFYTQMGFVKCGTMRLNFEIMKPEVRGMVAMKISTPSV